MSQKWYSQPKRNYSRFPNSIIDNGILGVMTPIETKVAMIIYRGCSNNKGICRYSIETIIKKSGHHRDSVFTALKGLYKLGIFKSWLCRDKSTEKLQTKRYFCINWDGGSLAGVFKRQRAIQEKKKRCRERNNLKSNKCPTA